MNSSPKTAAKEVTLEIDKTLFHRVEMEAKRKNCPIDEMLMQLLCIGMKMITNKNTDSKNNEEDR